MSKFKRTERQWTDVTLEMPFNTHHIGIVVPTELKDGVQLYKAFLATSIRWTQGTTTVQLNGKWGDGAVFGNSTTVQFDDLPEDIRDALDPPKSL